MHDYSKYDFSKYFLGVNSLTFLLLLTTSISTYADNTKHIDLYRKSDLQLFLRESSIFIESNINIKRKNIKLPDVVIVKTNYLCRMAFSKNHTKFSSYCHLIQGLYNYNEKKIYINYNVNLNTILGKIVLIHELVHFYQNEFRLADYNTSNREKLPKLIEEKYTQLKLALAQ